MAKDKKADKKVESKAEAKAPVLDTPKDEEVKVEAQAKIEEHAVKAKDEVPKVEKLAKEPKVEKTPCGTCSTKFDSASCKSCVIFKRLKK